MKTNRTIVSAAYGTHITPLVAAFLNTKGAVLELGMGDYSTPVLNMLCKSQKRRLISVESDIEWAENFIDLNIDDHFIMMYDDFNLDDNDKMKFGLVLIDHAPAENRVKDMIRLRARADVFVVHDTEKTKWYGWEPTLSSFKYRYDYPRYAKRTTLLSDTIDVSKFF